MCVCVCVCTYKHGEDEKCDATTDIINANGVRTDKYLHFAELSNNNNISTKLKFYALEKKNTIFL